jgi:hypothetical protein
VGEHAQPGPLGVLIDDGVDQEVVHVLVGDQDGVRPGERLPLAEPARVDHQHTGVGFEAHTGVRVLDQSHRTS